MTDSFRSGANETIMGRDRLAFHSEAQEQRQGANGLGRAGSILSGAQAKRATLVM